MRYLRTLIPSIIATVSFASVQALADDDPNTQAPFYVGVNMSHNSVANALPDLKYNRKQLGFGIDLGYKRNFEDSWQFFYGVEGQINYLGSDSWGGSSSASAKYFQLNVLGTVHYLPIAHLDLTLKAGLGWQMVNAQKLHDVNGFVLPVVGAGIGYYVSSNIEVNANWQYTAGSGDGKALSGSGKTVANNQYSIGINYHF